MLQTLTIYSLRFGLLIITAKLISIEDFGYFAAISAVYTLFFHPLLNEAYSSVYIRKSDRSKIVNSSLLLANTCLYILGSVMFSIWLSIFDLGLKGLDLVYLLPSLLIAGGFNLISSTSQTILKNYSEYNLIAKVNIASVIISSLVGILGAFYFADLKALLIPLILEQVLCGVLYFVIFKKSGNYFLFKSDFVILREYKSAFSFFIVSVLSIFNQRVIGLVSAYFLSPIQVGMLFMAQRIQQLIMQVVSTSVGSVIFPFLSKSKKNSEEELNKICSLTLLCFAPILGMISLNADVIFVVLGKEQWGEIKPLFIMFLFSCLPYIIAFNFDAYIMANGKQFIRLILLIVNGAVSCIILYYGRYLELELIALLMVLRVYVYAVVICFIWYRFFSFNIAQLVVSLVAAVVIFILIGPLNQGVSDYILANDMLRFIFKNTITLVFLFVFYIFIRRKRDEWFI
jgi:O-antigen/teichoic acid export membrane protein